MTFQTFQLADAITAVGIRPEGVRLPVSLRASNVGAGVHGEGALASAFVAARTDLSRGMPSLPAGDEMRAGQQASTPSNPLTTEDRRERTRPVAPPKETV